MQSRVDRQIRALALAQQCAAHGARVRTISRITGMNPRDLLRLLFPERQSVPRGRAPDSPEWYHGANLLYRAEASIVMSIYRRLRTADFSGGEAFLGYSPLGQGKVDLPAVLAMLNGRKMDGMVMVELDSSPNMPMPALETARIARAYLMKQGVALKG